MTERPDSYPPSNTRPWTAGSCRHARTRPADRGRRIPRRPAGHLPRTVPDRLQAGICWTADEWLAAADDARLGGIREICRRTGMTAVVGCCAHGSGRHAAAGVPRRPPGRHLSRSASRPTSTGRSRISSPPATVPPSWMDGWKVALAICFDAPAPATRTGRGRGGRGHLCRLGALHGRAKTTGWGCISAPGPWTTGCSRVLANLGGATPLGPSCGLSGSGVLTGSGMRQAAGTGTEVVTASPAARVPRCGSGMPPVRAGAASDGSR